MVAKIMSSVSLMCAVGLYLLNSSNPADPMFFIVSGDRTIATARIGLALLMSVSAFAVVLRKRSYRLGTGIFGAVLVASALAFLTVSWFNYSLSDYAKPMDLVMAAQAGIVFLLLAIEPNRRTIKIAEFPTVFQPPVRRLKSAIG